MAPTYRELPLLDADGLYRIPSRFYLWLLLLLRPYVAWILALTMPEQHRAILQWFYPHSQDFIRALLCALPAVLVLMAMTQRVPHNPKQSRGRYKAIWFGLWRQSGWLLAVTGVVDLFFVISHLPPQVALKAPWLLIIAALLVLGSWWVLRSAQLRHVFAEWPEDKAS